MKVVSNVPCYNCQKRTTRCHSDCKDYKEYASKNLAKKSKAEAHWKKDKDFYSYYSWNSDEDAIWLCEYKLKTELGIDLSKLESPFSSEIELKK